MTKPPTTRGDTLTRALVLAAALAFAVLFAILLRRRAHGAPGLGPFLIAAAALALLYASAIVWRTSARAKLLLVSFAVALPVYLVEIALTTLGAAETRALAEAAPGAERRSKLEMVKSLRAAGADAWPSVHPSIFLGSSGVPIGGGEKVFPLGGISRARTVYCLEGDAYSLFDSDEHGFNNPLGLYKKDEIDVALIGDSFVQGACVAPGEDVTALLRQTPLRALGLGSGGDGPLLELATLIEYAAPLRPRVVLWLYYEGNDLSNLEAERVNPSLMRYLDDPSLSPHLAESQDAIDRALKSFAAKQRDAAPAPEPPKSSAVIRILKLSTLRARLNAPRDPEPTPLFTRTLQRSNEIVTGWGGKLYFVYLPEWRRYHKKVEKTNFKFRSYGRILELMKGLDIPVIDFQESLATLEDPLTAFPKRQPGHYNAAGYARLAEVIRARLAADKALPDSH